MSSLAVSGLATAGKRLAGDRVRLVVPRMNSYSLCVCKPQLLVIPIGFTNRKPVRLWHGACDGLYDFDRRLREEALMLKSLFIIILCAVTLPAFCEPSPKYEVATVVDVKPHQAAGDNSSSTGATYDVSVKVGNTIYMVLYTDTLGTTTVRYIAGREVLVHVGKSTITYNDISGRSQEVPIISQRPAKTVSASK